MRRHSSGRHRVPQHRVLVVKALAAEGLADARIVLVVDLWRRRGSAPCGHVSPLRRGRQRRGFPSGPARWECTGPKLGAVSVTNTAGCSVTRLGDALAAPKAGGDELEGVAAVGPRAGRADGLAAVAAARQQRLVGLARPWCRRCGPRRSGCRSRRPGRAAGSGGGSSRCRGAGARSAPSARGRRHGRGRRRAAPASWTAVAVAVSARAPGPLDAAAVRSGRAMARASAATARSASASASASSAVRWSCRRIGPADRSQSTTRSLTVGGPESRWPGSRGSTATDPQLASAFAAAAWLGHLLGLVEARRGSGRQPVPARRAAARSAIARTWSSSR